MNKMLYVTLQDIDKKSAIGIKKKIFGQMSAFEKYGYDCNLISFSKNKIKLTNQQGYESIIKSNVNKLKRLRFYKAMIELLDYEDFNIVYVRYFYTDPLFLQVLKLYKRRNIKVILEIPTFPYDNEISSKIGKLVDEIFRKKLKKYVYRVVTFSNDSRIFGVDTISIENGININEIKEKRLIQSENINLIGVANLSSWHGYDRVIEGMKRYYENNVNTKIYFNIVGEGNAKIQLESLSKEYCLEKYINFHDSKNGEELDNLFDVSDMAIGSLGIHRLGLESVSTLKSKEYFARGIPFIYSYKEKFIEEDNCKGALKIAANEEAVDIYKLVEYVNNNSFKELNKYMIAYSKRNLGWEKQIKKIIDIL